jgi:hypothetical protein
MSNFTPSEQKALAAIDLAEVNLKTALAAYEQAVQSAHPGVLFPDGPMGLRSIHSWFELTYAQYLTIPRSVLQSMPHGWQHRFVGLMDELDELIDWRPRDGTQYRVTLHRPDEDAEDDEVVDDEDVYWGPAIDDPLMDYARGRRKLPLKKGHEDV